MHLRGIFQCKSAHDNVQYGKMCKIFKVLLIIFGRWNEFLFGSRFFLFYFFFFFFSYIYKDCIVRKFKVFNINSLDLVLNIVIILCFLFVTFMTQFLVIWIFRLWAVEVLYLILFLLARYSRVSHVALFNHYSHYSAIRSEFQKSKEFQFVSFWTAPYDICLF